MSQADTKFAAIMQAYENGNSAQAYALCQKLLKRFPNHAPTLHMQAVLMLYGVAAYDQSNDPKNQRKTYLNALRLAEKASRLDPTNPTYLTTLGTLYRVDNQFKKAEQHYLKALKYVPNNALALEGLGQIHWNLANKDALQKEKAEQYFKQAIICNPDLEIAFLSLAKLSLELEDPAQAAEYGEKALARHPTPLILNVLATSYLRLEREPEAERCYQQAIADFPKHADAYRDYAEYCLIRGRSEEALEYAQQAHALNQSNLVILGRVLEDTGDLSEAEHLYQQAQQQRPNPYIYCCLAANYTKQGLTEQATSMLCKSLIENVDIQALISGIFLYFESCSRDWKLYSLASDVFSQVQQRLVDPKHSIAVSVIHSALQSLATNHGRLLAVGDRTPPDDYSDYLIHLHYSTAYSREEIYAAHQEFDRLFAQPLFISASSNLTFKNAQEPNKRLRIGYVSSDFREHSVAYFAEPILAAHDPAKTEVFCYYVSQATDSVTERFQQYCTGGWRHCWDWSDDKLATTIRQDKIDILVDLMGHMGKNRILVFARKPAPIQISYLGYSDTTGLSTIDYRITDVLVEPEGAEAFSSERLLRMPHSYFCYRPSDIAKNLPIKPLPALNNGYITFASFNLYTKVNDAHIRRWAKIMARLPNSKFLLKVRLHGDGLRSFKTIIKARFQSLGIAPERLIIKDFSRLLEVALQMYNDVDICLDTHPYSGATTTCESLWMGCPVVSLYGENHASRMSLSILSAVGLGDLAVSDEDSYVETAVNLAQDWKKLADLRATMRECLQTSPLMDEKGFAGALEQQYRKIWQAYCEPEQVAAPQTQEQSHANAPDTQPLDSSLKQIEQHKREESVSIALLKACPITIATSIAPKGLDKQKAAISSWLDIGFKVISFNNADEIALLKDEFSAVEFHLVSRDAREDCGKPMVYVNDVLDYFKNSNERISAIVNSDVYLKNSPDTIRYIITQATQQPIICSRVDLDHLENRDGVLYRGGFDAFFFNKSMLDTFTQTKFCIGQPWWDYWLPLAWIKHGYKPKYIISPFAYHIEHPVQWSAYFSFYGLHFLQTVKSAYGPKNYGALMQLSKKNNPDKLVHALGIEANYTNQFILFNMEWVGVL
jgi:predicted O-linked N-acetylglucosamine transferase (SPINDLY family)